MDIEKPAKPSDPSKAIELMKSLGWKIVDPFYQTVPTPKSLYIERCVGDVSGLTDYLLKAVVIEDNIVDHSERRAVEMRHPAVAEFSSKYSKLGLNISQNMLFHMEEIIEKCSRRHKEKGDELNRIAELSSLKEEFSKYRSLDFANKVAFIRKLDGVIYKFLEALSH